MALPVCGTVEALAAPDPLITYPGSAVGRGGRCPGEHVGGPVDREPKAILRSCGSNTEFETFPRSSSPFSLSGFAITRSDLSPVSFSGSNDRFLDALYVGQALTTDRAQ